MPEGGRRYRVLIGKPGLDGHDRGAKIVAKALRDARMEVIYTGRRQLPEQIVNAAIQEDVDAIGLSILSGDHDTLVTKILEELSKKGRNDMLVFLGGIIPKEDGERLKNLGVTEVFGPGTNTSDIVQRIKNEISAKWGSHDAQEN